MDLEWKENEMAELEHVYWILHIVSLFFSISPMVFVLRHGSDGIILVHKIYVKYAHQTSNMPCYTNVKPNGYSIAEVSLVVRWKDDATAMW